MSVRIVKSDKRLLGTWQSDRARTAQLWGFKKGVRLTPKKRSEFFSIFGDLTWRFTKTRLYTQLADRESFRTYEILDADDRSVVLRLFEDRLKKSDRETFEALGVGELLLGDHLQQIYFDGDDYIYVESSWNVEFFKRVV